MNYFKHFMKDCGRGLMVPICMIILGIIFIVNSADVVNVITQMIGWLLIICGIGIALSLFAAYSPFVMVSAICLAAFGTFIVLNPAFISGFVIKVIGLLVLVEGVVKISETLRVKDLGDRYWKSYMINDVITAVIGAVLLFVPFAVAQIAAIIIGVIIALLGVTNIITEYKLYKLRKIAEDGDVVWEE